MELARHGLRVVLRPLSYFAPQPDGGYLIVDRDPERTRREVSRFSVKDAERLPAFHERLERIVDLMRTVILRDALQRQRPAPRSDDRARASPIACASSAARGRAIWSTCSARAPAICSIPGSRRMP